MRSGKFALALTAGLLGALFCHAAAQSVTKAEKEEFIRLLAKAPREGEFFTKEGIDQLAPHIKTLFAFTEEDVASADLYPFLASSAGLCERQSSRDYGVAHFSEIAHPMIKLGWAVLIFETGAASPEVVAYLRAAFDSPERSKDLAQMLGPEFKAFKKRVVGR